MIFNFRTAPDANGHSEYLSFDTDAKTFRVEYRKSELTSAVKIGKRDYTNMVRILREKEDWTEQNTLISFR